MTWRILFDAHAMRALAGFPPEVRRRLQRKATALIEDPLRKRPGADIKRLQAMPGVLRLRIGDYRLFYSVFPSEKTVVVTDVKHRSHAYD